MAEKKATTKKAAEVKETKVAAKKSTTAKKCAPKATAAKATVAVNAENIGFKAGDVYWFQGRRCLSGTGSSREGSRSKGDCKGCKDFRGRDFAGSWLAVQGG